MELGFDIESLQTRGRRPAPLALGAVEDIDELDLEALATMPRGAPAPVVQKMTERHHQLAKLIAAGETNAVAAATVGYAVGSVIQLRANPAFQELVEMYHDASSAEYAEFAGQLTGLAKDAVVTLRERLEDDPEKFTNNTLLEVIKTTADRSGFGPSSKQEVNIYAGFAAKLAQARERAAMKDITPDE